MSGLEVRPAPSPPAQASLVGLTLLAAIAPLVGGTTYVVTTEMLPPDRPLTAGFLRAAVAGLLLLAIAPGVPPVGWRLRTVVLGVLNIGAFFPLLFISAYRLPGGLAAVVGSLQPLIIAALTATLGWRQPPRRQVALAVVAAAGVALMTVTSRTTVDAWGLTAAIAGTASMAVGILLSSRWRLPAGYRPLTCTAWQLVVGGVVIAPLVPFTDSGALVLDGAAVLGYLWLALVGGAIGYGVWLHGARQLPPASTALLGMLSPLMAAVLGWVVLGQSLGPLQCLGFALALGGAASGQLVGLRAARRDRGAH